LVVKRESRREHNPVEGSSEKALAKAERLAPLEEYAEKPDRQKLKGEGVINVDTGNLKLPGEFGEEERKSSLFRVEPLTVVILLFALAFIVFIAYLISIEPQQARDEAVPTVERKP
jgi:hypothetical protein